MGEVVGEEEEEGRLGGVYRWSSCSLASPISTSSSSTWSPLSSSPGDAGDDAGDTGSLGDDTGSW